MHDDQHPKQRKFNEINGLQRCPQGSDVGVFGETREFFDSMTAGFVYAAAIETLVEQTLEINRMLETMDEEEKAKLLPTLQEDLREIDTKWLLATRMFSIYA